MTSPFDDAGKLFRGPSYRAALTMALLNLLVLAGLWLATSWALNEAVLAEFPTQVGEYRAGKSASSDSGWTRS